jgi:hypothetical protein
MGIAGNLILFSDVEAAVRAELNSEFATRMPDVRWGTKIPNPRPAAFGRLLRLGGPKETLISEMAHISLEGWAYDEVDAIAILNLGRAVLNAQDGTLFGVTEISGPNNLPDPTTSQVRYTQLFGVRMRGAVTA